MIRVEEPSAGAARQDRVGEVIRPLDVFGCALRFVREDRTGQDRTGHDTLVSAGRRTLEAGNCIRVDLILIFILFCSWGVERREHASARNEAREAAGVAGVLQRHANQSR